MPPENGSGILQFPVKLVTIEKRLSHRFLTTPYSRVASPIFVISNCCSASSTFITFW